MKKKNNKPKQSILGKIIGALALVVTLVIAIAFVASAYSGKVSPSSMRIAPIMVMTFPIWLAAIVGITVIDLIWWRRTSLIGIAAILVCLPQIWDFCPLNLPKGKMDEEQKARSFTLMTYNVLQFVNQDKNSVWEYNQQLEYIIEQAADVVCIQEAEFMGPTPSTKITTEQLDDIKRIYPYIYHHPNEFTFLSKYKAEPLPFDFPKSQFRSGDAAGWRIYIDDKPINIFVVHLCSYKLDPSLKELFRELTTPESVDRQIIKEARNELAPKIVISSKERARQAKELDNILRKYGGETAIVCGDFNDPVGGYALNYLEKYCDMRQVYSEVGLGPMITFNANHFFFRIDHILYRGALTPWSIKRGDVRASDHYPVTATFIVD